MRFGVITKKLGSILHFLLLPDLGSGQYVETMIYAPCTLIVDLETTLMRIITMIKDKQAPS
ncbi:hypothetical protein D3C87_2148540 [compost metagenome]